MPSDSERLALIEHDLARLHGDLAKAFNALATFSELSRERDTVLLNNDHILARALGAYMRPVYGPMEPLPYGGVE